MAQKVAVLGAGSWGTALAFLALQGQNEVSLWARDSELLIQLDKERQNEKYLPGISLENIRLCPDLKPILADSDWIVSAVPCLGIPELAEQVKVLRKPDSIVVSGTKGLHSQLGLRPAQMWHNFGGLAPAEYVALSGPNLAREIVCGVPTSTVVASEDIESAKLAQRLFSSPLFRVYTNVDLTGVELGGGLKNVVAIAAGVCDGLGFGDNAKAALMTRHWREMTRLAIAFGAKETTLFGLSGIGDLFATCASPHSRNHSLGVKLGSGESLSQAQREVMQVVEGVHTARAALKLASEKGVELPVTSELVALFDGKPVKAAIHSLMNREGRSEVEE